MLADVRDYLRQRGTVSLRDLALRFDMEPDAMRELLGVWLRKGRVRRVADAGGADCGSACGGGCSGCGSPGPESEQYAWTAAEPGPVPVYRKP